jgi:hypothetical protein
MATKPEFRRYWPVPPLIDHVYEYININKDIRLRQFVTDFFQKELLIWIDNDMNFASLKSQKKYFTSTDGIMKIYNLLRKFNKKSGINWYDMRDNYVIIKYYLEKKLTK